MEDARCFTIIRCCGIDNRNNSYSPHQRAICSELVTWTTRGCEQSGRLTQHSHRSPLEIDLVSFHRRSE